MAVSLSTGGFFMSEFMISDAALAARMQDMQDMKEQSADFAALLNGFDDAEKTEAAKPGEVNQTDQSEREQIEQAEQTEQPNGQKGDEVRANEVSKDKVTEAEGSEDKTEPEKLTAEQMVFAALHTVEVGGEISAEFEELTASVMENAEVEEVAPKAVAPTEVAPMEVVDGEAENTVIVSKQTVPEEYFKTEADEAQPQKFNTERDADFTVPELKEILKSVDAPESIEEPKAPTADSSEKAAAMTDAPNPEAVVPKAELKESAELGGIIREAADDRDAHVTEALRDMPEKAESVGTREIAEDVPVKTEESVSEEAPAEITAPIAEAVAAERNVKQTTGARTENEQLKTERVSEKSAVFVEVKDFVESAAKAQTETEGGETDASGSQKSFEAFGKAVEKGEVSAPEVRTVTRETPVKAQNTEERAETEQTAQPVAQTHTQYARRGADVKMTSVTEELEMLKNAKVKNVQTGEKPTVSPENPLSADTPILLARENGERVEVRPGEIIEQAAAKLVETAQTMKEQATEYSMVLNPEELGRIVVKLVKAADGAVSVTIAADNARTQRILEQHSAAMQENLRDSGVKLEGWQMVRESEQETYAQDYNGSSKNPYYREENHSHGEQEGEETDFAELIASM